MIQIYTGDGKGKTTAALGLAMRAAGHGMRTLFIQFMKKGKTGELVSAMLMPGLVEIEQYGREEFYVPEGAESSLTARGGNGSLKVSHDKALFAGDAEKGIARAEKALEVGDYDMVVMDEIINLVSLEIIEEERIIGLAGKFRKAGRELVLTGRGASGRLAEAADLVTEMRKIRHWFDTAEGRSAGARKGIEY